MKPVLIANYPSLTFSLTHPIIIFIPQFSTSLPIMDTVLTHTVSVQKNTRQVSYQTTYIEPIKFPRTGLIFTQKSSTSNKYLLTIIIRMK